MIDSESVKAPHGATRGYDAGKKIVGRKRHIAVDTDGRLLINLPTADIRQHRSAGDPQYDPQTLAVGETSSPIPLYDRLQMMDKATYLRFVIEIIRGRDGQKGFEVLPRRWVVERTIGWMIRWRRLIRDYERRIDVTTAMIHGAMVGVLIRKNARP